MHTLSNFIPSKLINIARLLCSIVLLTLLILLELPKAIVLTVASHKWRRRAMNEALLDAVIAVCCVVGAAVAGFAAAGMYYLLLLL